MHIIGPILPHFAEELHEFLDGVTSSLSFFSCQWIPLVCIQISMLYTQAYK